MGRSTGFTLIELLIVVAIIAILAAIAVPNFLEAQTRAKVSRVVSDIRALRTAIEAYRIDHNVYPPNTDNGARGFPEEFKGQVVVGTLWVDISTPIAYITNAFLLDVFNDQNALDTGTHDEALFIYQNLASQYC
jgi:prepilin-type N-terminal cleavage/methylation domain-containing protein